MHSDQQVINQSSNMFNQLEAMMSAVRQEAENFESLKAKVKDYDEIKKEMPSLILRLQQSEKLNNVYFEQKTLSDEIINKLRVDMQRLNDMFNSERRQHLEAKQTQIRQEQELNRVMREVDHLQKDANLIMDTKKTNQHLQLQNTLLQQRLDDEKANLQKSLRLMEKQHEEAEKVKSELSVHFWNLSEELKSTQQALLVCNDYKTNLEKKFSSHLMESNCLRESFLMSAEDLLSYKHDTNMYISDIEKKYNKIQKLNKSLESKHLSLDQEIVELNRTFHQAVSEKENEKSLHTQTVKELTTELVFYKNYHASNSEVEIVLKGKLAAYEKDLQLSKNNFDSMCTTNQDLERQLKAAHAECASLRTEKENLLVQVQSNSTVSEALHLQFNEVNQTSWENLQKLKDMELQYEHDKDSFEANMSEMTTKYQQLQKDSDAASESFQKDIGSLTHITTLLKQELEKRLEELSTSNQNNQALRQEIDKMKAHIEEIGEELIRKDTAFKNTLEQDRSKIAADMRSKTLRIRSLENEKNDLLNETSSCMKQMELISKEKSAMDKEYKSLTCKISEYQIKLEEVSQSNQQLSLQNDLCNKQIDDLKAFMSENEEKFRVDITRLDSIVKESRKSATQQVTEMSNQIQQLQDEYNHTKEKNAEYEMKEKKMLKEQERLCVEIEQHKSNYSDFQSKLTMELSVSKRELSGAQAKVKQLSENKVQNEMDMAQLQMESVQKGNEIKHLHELNKDMQIKVNNLESSMSTIRNENNILLTNNQRMKANIVEMEQILIRKTKNIEDLNSDLERTEKEGYLEMKKLRIKNGKLQESLDGQTENVTRITKELEESQHNYNKLHQSTNVTVNSMIEELKNTELALANTRKEYHNEVNTSAKKIMELNMTIENMKESFAERLHQSKSEKSDGHLQVSLLSGELTRLRSLSETKDKHIEDLENNHRTDRKKIQELMEVSANSDRIIIELKSQMANSENKLKTAEKQLQVLKDRDASKIEEEEDFRISRKYNCDDDDVAASGVRVVEGKYGQSSPYGKALSKSSRKSPRSKRVDSQTQEYSNMINENSYETSISGNASKAQREYEDDLQPNSVTAQGHASTYESSYLSTNYGSNDRQKDSHILEEEYHAYRDEQILKTNHGTQQVHGAAYDKRVSASSPRASGAEHNANSYDNFYTNKGSSNANKQAVESSIEKTQQFLNRKKGLAATTTSSRLVDDTAVKERTKASSKYSDFEIEGDNENGDGLIEKQNQSDAVGRKTNVSYLTLPRQQNEGGRIKPDRSAVGPSKLVMAIPHSPILEPQELSRDQNSANGSRYTLDDDAEAELLRKSSSYYDNYPLGDNDKGGERDRDRDREKALVKSNSASIVKDGFTRSLSIAENDRKKDTKTTRVKRIKSSDGSTKRRDSFDEEESGGGEGSSSRGVQLPVITPNAFKPNSRGSRRL